MDVRLVKGRDEQAAVWQDGYLPNLAVVLARAESHLSRDVYSGWGLQPDNRDQVFYTMAAKWPGYHPNRRLFLFTPSPSAHRWESFPTLLREFDEDKNQQHYRYLVMLFDGLQELDAEHQTQALVSELGMGLKPDSAYLDRRCFRNECEILLDMILETYELPPAYHVVRALREKGLTHPEGLYDIFNPV